MITVHLPQLYCYLNKSASSLYTTCSTILCSSVHSSVQLNSARTVSHMHTPKNGGCISLFRSNLTENIPPDTALCVPSTFHSPSCTGGRVCVERRTSIAQSDRQIARQTGRERRHPTLLFPPPLSILPALAGDRGKKPVLRSNRARRAYELESRASRGVGEAIEVTLMR